jgi:hypothetical protein
MRSIMEKPKMTLKEIIALIKSGKLPPLGLDTNDGLTNTINKKKKRESEFWEKE